MPLKTATLIAIVGIAVGLLFSLFGVVSLVVSPPHSFGLALRYLGGGVLPQSCLLLFLVVLHRNQR